MIERLNHREIERLRNDLSEKVESLVGIGNRSMIQSLTHSIRETEALPACLLG